jgi:hypothetical protein
LGASAHALSRPRAPELAEALALSPVQRLEQSMRFFDWHSGLPMNMPMGYGFGQSIVDFITWETASGRLDPMHGSPWWRAVNGAIVLDLMQAREHFSQDEPTGDHVIDAWRSYGRYAASWRERARLGYVRQAQALFWEAHQRSLHRAVDCAVELFSQESATEREFIETIALHNVDHAALSNDVSYLDTIAVYTLFVYPSRYPATQTDLQRARPLRIEKIPMSACYGNTFENVGVCSTRWREGSRSVPSDPTNALPDHTRNRNALTGLSVASQNASVNRPGVAGGSSI